MAAIWLFLLHVSAYIAISLWAAFFAYKYNYVPKQFIVTVAFGFVAVLYYVIFFLTLANPSLGLWTNYAVHGSGWCLALFSLYKIKGLFRNRAITICILLPLSIIVLLLSYYTILLTNCRLTVPGSHKDDNSTYCHLHFLPGDNELAFLYAKNVKQHKSQELISDWKLVDRPPIQIGAGLGILDLNDKSRDDYRAYQLVASFMQLSWVAAVFGLLVTLRLRFRQIILAIGIMGLSGFIYFNSVFVWPKFFASSLVVMACSLLFNTADKYYKRSAVSAITAMGLAVLIHDGVTFTIISAALVLAWVWFRSKKKIPLRPIVLGCLIALLLVAPWLVYKNRHSTSDHLIKWHFAGVTKVDNRSTVQTIKDSYKNTPAHTLLENRKLNIETLYTPFEKPELSSGIKDLGFSAATLKASLRHLATWYEQNDFFIVFFALGLFNIGWVLALLRRKHSNISVLEKRLLAVSAISIAIWVLVMFLPRSTVLHQGSYATMLLLFSLLATWIARSNLLLPLFIIQYFLFNIFWVIGVYYRYGVSVHKAVPGALAGLAFMGIFLALAKVSKKWQAVYKLKD